MAFKFHGVDFLGLDSSFSEDELLVRRTARDFVEDNLIPIIEGCFREGRFPRELVPRWANWASSGPTSKGYGCAGMSNVEYGLVMQELERGDSGIRSFVSVQSALVMYPIYTFGSEEQKNTWLPGAGHGREARLLWPDGAGVRLQPGRHEDHRAQIRRRLRAERREDVDHVGQYRGRGRGLGQGGGRGQQGARIPGGDGPAGIQGVSTCMASGRCGRR